MRPNEQAPSDVTPHGSGRRSVAAYRADVTALLIQALNAVQQRTPERLSLDTRAMTEHPDRYADRVTASAVYSTVAVPLFDNSQMDGYAVSSADLATATPTSPVTLRADGTVAAGDRVRALDPGTAVAVMTGAPIPVGADAVVPIESVAAAHSDGPRWADHGASVTFTQSVPTGQFVRRHGSDVEEGGLVLPEGHRLTPASWGTLASVGVTDVAVRPRPHVLLVTTGLELRAPGEALRPGQIFDANSYAMTQALSECGCTVDTVTCRSDDPVVLQDMLQPYLATTDFIITVGGVSAGRFEVIRDYFGPAGVEFEAIAMQPGGPQGNGLARLSEGNGTIAIPTFAFPGNPVSALISFELLMRSTLRRATGRWPVERVVVTATLAEDATSPAGKLQVRRAQLDASDDDTMGDSTPSVPIVRLVGGPSSHLIHAYAMANALAFIPADVTEVSAGDHVEVWMLDGSGVVDALDAHVSTANAEETS